jgi:cytochrome c-type biogenesis protein CcmF
MIGTIGNLSILLAFLFSVAAAVFYYLGAKKERTRHVTIANSLFVAKGVLMLVASALLMYLLLTNSFQYFYVYNYTSLDLQTRYLIAAFYSGQEGSLMLWILCSFFVGVALIRWTSKMYRAPVMFFMTLTQIFLLWMLLGVDFFGIKVGISPFRTLAEAMPDAPVFQTNPGFVPADGSGLNDLLRSPWIVIHPPVLFLGFAMMTVPYAFAMAALWREQYRKWVYPALPWTLGANLALLTAIFLGGYWAYETLSFGGYWAWDPVENASLVPWIFGVAGIHAMLIQRKSNASVKASIVFALLAYMTIVYETFLTRSGVLGDSSVHSFVDLGLYNQLLIFMLVMVVIGFAMFLYRYKRMPKPDTESPVISRDFMMIAGAMVLFVTGLIIILGTSTPIIGRLFVPNPTPPEMAFYNQWTMPFGILIALMTVVTQYLWWKKHNLETLSGALIMPTLLTSIVTVAVIVTGNIRDLGHMIFLFAGFFAVVGNGAVMLRLLRNNPRIVGGTVTHIGFGIMLLGILGSAYDRPLLDLETRAYNAAILRGEVFDDDGFQQFQTIDVIQLEMGTPKIVGDEFVVTYLAGEVVNQNRPGEQKYTLQFERLDGRGRPFILQPVVYPMLANSSPGNISWTVDPEVRTGMFSDIYLYVGGSSLVQRETARIENEATIQAVARILGEEPPADNNEQNHFRVRRGGSVVSGQFTITFSEFINLSAEEQPDNAIVAVKAKLDFRNRETGQEFTATPLFAIVADEEGRDYYSPLLEVQDPDLKIRFTGIDPSRDQIEVHIEGLDAFREQDWILITVERKPFVSVVWLGTFLLMFGFSIAIFHRWNDQKKREKKRSHNA